MLIKERILQHGKILHWNNAEFWIWIHNITFHKLKNWIFICHMFTSLGKIIVQVNRMKYLWFNKISLTKNLHMIIQKYFSYWVDKFTHNTYLIVSPFLWRMLRLGTSTDWNHQPYLWNNLILIYLIKVISIIELLQHIFILFFKSLSQKVSYLHYWQQCGIKWMITLVSIVVHLIFIYDNVSLWNFPLLFTDQLVHLEIANMLLMVWII